MELKKYENFGGISVLKYNDVEYSVSLCFWIALYDHLLKKEESKN